MAEIRTRYGPDDRNSNPGFADDHNPNPGFRQYTRAGPQTRLQPKSAAGIPPTRENRAQDPIGG